MSVGRGKSPATKAYFQRSSSPRIPKAYVEQLQSLRLIGDVLPEMQCDVEERASNIEPRSLVSSPKFCPRHRT